MSVQAAEPRPSQASNEWGIAVRLRGDEAREIRLLMRARDYAIGRGDLIPVGEPQIYVDGQYRVLRQNRLTSAE